MEDCSGSINYLPLVPEWTPPRLLIRDAQLKTLMKWIDKGTDSTGKPLFPPNFWIEGDKGTGKTYTVKHCYLPVIREKRNALTYHFEMRDAGMRDNLEAFSRENLKKTTKDQWEICRQIEKESEDKDMVVLAFDDMHKVTQLKRDWSGVLHDIYEYFSDIRERHLTSDKKGLPLQLQMLVISHYKYPHRKRYLAEDTLSRFQFNRVTFGPYTEEELRKILFQRLNAAFETLPSDAKDIITYIARETVNRLDGDCRVAVDILRGSVSETSFSIKEAVRYCNKKCDEYWGQNYLNEFPPHRALVFYVIAKLTMQRKEKNDCDEENPPVYLSDVHRNYKRICERLEVEPRVKQSTHNDVKKFEEYDYVKKERLKKDDKRNYKWQYGLFITLKVRADPIARAGDVEYWGDRLS